MRRYFLATLLDDAVLSQHAATAGDHAGLDYLPGSNFLGAAAARLYSQCDSSKQRALFHSGKLRFGCALPVSEERQPGYPVPACWHYQKGEEGNRSIVNHQHTSYRGEQPVQYRNEYFTETGKFFTPNRSFRLKTALDPVLGTAADSQLFGYSALTKGSAFWGKLEADNEYIPKEWFEEVADVLSGNIRIGRSRSAEYGRVSINFLPEAEAQKLSLPTPEDATEVTLWLLSDTALHDEHGQPTLQPSGDTVGLPGLRLKPGMSYLRTTSYAPYNGHRRYRELERLVLLAGSVLHFTSLQPISGDVLEALQARGIGLFRHYGLGQVWVNPRWLKEATPHFLSGNNRNATRFSQPDLPLETPSENDIVYRYLLKRRGAQQEAISVRSITNKWGTELKLLYRSALMLESFGSGVCVGPSSSQWSRVMQAAQDCIQTQSDICKLRPRLFEGHQAICKADDIQWSKKVLIQNKPEIRTFRDWLLHKLQDQEATPKLVAHFAHLAMTLSAEAGCNQEKEENQ